MIIIIIIIIVRDCHKWLLSPSSTASVTWRGAKAGANHFTMEASGQDQGRASSSSASFTAWLRTLLPSPWTILRTRSRQGRKSVLRLAEEQEKLRAKKKLGSMAPPQWQTGLGAQSALGMKLVWKKHSTELGHVRAWDLCSCYCSSTGGTNCSWATLLLGGCWKAVAFSSSGLVLRWMPASLSASHWNSLGKQVLFLLLASLWKHR